MKALIGEAYEGVLGSDFYAGYNSQQGLQQRCGVHVLRDLQELKQLYPDRVDVGEWAAQVKQLYARARAAPPPDPPPPFFPPQAHRVALHHACEQELWQVGAPFAKTRAPQHTLCERVARFLPEVFVFLAVPGVPSHNNLAERSGRPLVIARKISGGTRSPTGSATRMGLASLFGTWVAQGLTPFHQCVTLLSSNFFLGQV